jgi:hypothetical protein
MAELADAADLKSAAARLVGSSPSPGTSFQFNYILTDNPTALQKVVGICNHLIRFIAHGRLYFFETSRYGSRWIDIYPLLIIGNYRLIDFLVSGIVGHTYFGFR